MEELIIYLLKGAGVSGIFFLVYFFLLRNDTAFRLNRRFLLVGMLASLLLPLLTFTRTVLIDAPAMAFWTAASSEMLTSGSLPTEINWWQVGFYIYLAGFLLVLSKIILQLLSLLKFLRKGVKKHQQPFTLVHSEEQVQPFSFFRTIVFNPSLHSEEDLKMILQHEKAHAQQYHSADILLVNLFSSIFWFNPLVWLYKKLLIQNLEYLADKTTVGTTIPKKAYQKVLVKVSVGTLQPALVNSFYQSLIKKRIIMLNKNSSKKSPFWKVSLTLPLLAAFIFVFNVKTVAQVSPKKEAVAITVADGESLSILITPESTTADLEKAVALAKEKGIDLKFSEVDRNSDGQITAIQANYKRKGQSGSYVLNDEDGITPFTFFINDKNAGFRSASKGSAATFVRVHPTATYSFTGRPADSLRAATFTFYADTVSAARSSAPRASVITIRKDSTGNSRRTFHVSGSKSVYSDSPLIIVEGKEMPASFETSTIDPKSIDSIKVLKGENAVDEYGEKAKGGAIIIDLKDDQK